ncbi:hypothetical protein [Bacillus sp. UNC322MFChir4.1]|nr:hypothetical protein [Bacillus sp. UNC322MFChir4.1]
MKKTILAICTFLTVTIAAFSYSDVMKDSGMQYAEIKPGGIQYAEIKPGG